MNRQLAAAICAISIFFPTPATAGFFWHVTHSQGDIWLLGSVHVGKPDMYPLRPAVQSAFAASDALVVEADLATATLPMVQQALKDSGLLPADQRLRDAVDFETWNKLESLADKLDVSVVALDRLQPWLATMNLASIAFMRRGYDPEMGIDAHFQNRARASKPIIELESLTWQFQMLAGLDTYTQLAMLKATLDDLGNSLESVDEIVNIWSSGDQQAMHDLMSESMADPALYDTLITSRNQRMAGDIVALLPRHRSLFVIIGAGHMTGPQGIPALLSDRGYQVDEIN